MFRLILFEIHINLYYTFQPFVDFILHKKKNLITICILLSLIFSFPINKGSAILVWSEDFEDSPYDDWSLYGYDLRPGPYLKSEYPPIITNGSLQMSIPHMRQGCAVHNSFVAYGTWSFNFKIPEDNDSLGGIMFIGNGYGGGNSNLTGLTYNEISSTMRSYIIYINSGAGTADWVNDYSITLGTTFTTNNTINIIIYKGCSKDKISDVLLHELGHVLDIYMGNSEMWSFNLYNGWQDIVYFNNGVSNYANRQQRWYNKVVEDFAESCMLYWTNPIKFKWQYPKRFIKIRRLVSEFMYNDIGKLILNNY